MRKRLSLLVLASSLSSFTFAVETCGTFQVGAFACSSNSQCNSGPVFFDRDSIYHSGGWRMTDSSKTIGENWVFDLKLDGVSAYTLNNNAGSSSVSWAMPSAVIRGAATKNFLSVGNHTVSAKITKTSGSSCAETISYSVEQTKIIGILDKVISTGSNASAEGAMCIKGLSTGRIMQDVKVEFYAGADLSSAKSLGASVADKNSSYLSINNECSNRSNVGFTHVVSERQRADYCDQRVWSAIVNPDGSKSQISGSGSYYVPCALRPFVDEHQVEKSFFPWAIGLRGSNFKPGTRVEIYDGNGAFWGLGVGYAFNSSDRVSFQLPKNTTPSGCNANQACQIKVRLINPDGASSGVYTEIAVTLPTSKPVITNHEVVPAYHPWAIGLVGSGFEPSTTIELYDSDGKFWALGKDYAFNNTGRVSFQVPTNVPPSKCNLNGSCNIKVRVSNAPGSYTDLSVSLPSATPTISEQQLVTAYNPWAIGLRGSRFSPAFHIELIDADGKFWAGGEGETFNNSDRLSFQLPSNVPPSRCNVGKSCDIKFRYVDSTIGIYIERKITLPDVVPNISNYELVTAYNPWAIGLAGSRFSPGFHIELIDADGKFWGLGQGLAFNNSERVSFQLPSNIPPSRCNIGKTCTIKFRYVDSAAGIYIEKPVTLPKQ